MALIGRWLITLFLFGSITGLLWLVWAFVDGCIQLSRIDEAPRPSEGAPENADGRLREDVRPVLFSPEGFDHRRAS